MTPYVETKPNREQSLSLKKAIAVLRCFTNDMHSRSLPEIVTATGIPRTICYRLLSTLEDEGMANRDPATGRYSLSMALFAIGSTALETNKLAATASHYLSALSAQTQDTVLLIVEHEGAGMCISRVDGDFPIQQNALSVGKAWPIHVGGAPFCILSFMPDSQREKILSQPLDALTKHTVTDLNKIRARIAQVRMQGYAVGHEDALDYLVAIGAPIFDHLEKLIGAISVGGLTQRYPPERIAAVAVLACEAAAAISAKLGYRLSQPDLVTKNTAFANPLTTHTMT